MKKKEANYGCYALYDYLSYDLGAQNLDFFPTFATCYLFLFLFPVSALSVCTYTHIPLYKSYIFRYSCSICFPLKI